MHNLDKAETFLNFFGCTLFYDFYIMLIDNIIIFDIIVNITFN